MNFKSVTALVCLCAIFVSGCQKKSDDAPVSQRALTQDEQIAGFWKLKNPTQATGNGSAVPRILKFEMNSNQIRQVDFCDLGEVRQGMSGYEIDDNILVINYVEISYEKNETSPDSEPKLATITEKTFSGKITKLDADTLEINDEIIFERFIPSNNSALTDNASELCKE